jgi:parallel beta-helix repeat protein
VSAEFSPSITPIPTQGIPHGPILISDDAEFTSGNGVVGGNGTSNDPFVIEGWDIDARTSTGLEVRNTTAHFVIRSSAVASSFGAYDGVVLSNVSNARIEGFWTWLVRVGLSMRNVRNVTIAQSNLVRAYSYAVDVVGGENLELSGNTIENNVYPTRFESVSNVTIASNLIRDNNGTFNAAGVHMRKITGGSVSGNTISWNKGVAINLEESVGVSIEGNELAGGQFEGLSSTFSSDGTISNNRFSNYTYRGMFLKHPRNVTIAGNTILNSGEGIRLDAALNVSLSANSIAPGGVILVGTTLEEFNSHTFAANNLVNNLPLLFMKDCSGRSVRGVSLGQLIVVNCTGMDVANLAFQNSVGIQLAFVYTAAIDDVSFESPVTLGIVAFNVADLRLSRIQVTGMEGIGISIAEGVRVEIDGAFVPAGGIDLWAVTDGVVNGTSVAAYVWGITARNSRNISVSQNVLTRSEYGIFFEDVIRGMIIGNAIDGYSYRGTGVEVRRSRDVIVANNTVTRNSVGIRLDGSTGIQVHFNRFSYSSDSAEDPGGNENSWDAGYPRGGNYWLDYTGSDNCRGPNQDDCTRSDGIGDEPYSIDIDSIDRFPLVEYNATNEPPIALILISGGPFFVNDPVRLDFEGEDPDGSVVMFEWTLGDGTRGMSQANPTPFEHRYNAPNTYQVTLILTDNQGAISAAIVMIEVLPPPGDTGGSLTHPDPFLVGLLLATIGLMTAVASTAVVVFLFRFGRQMRTTQSPLPGRFR